MLALQTRQLIDPAEIRQAFRLRFRMYCEKLNWLDPSEYPDDLETDGYDEHSIHLGAFDGSRLVGYVRIILAKQLPIYAIEELAEKIPISPSLAEISRLIIDKNAIPDRKDFKRVVLGILREIHLHTKSKTEAAYYICTLDLAVFRVLRMYLFPFVPIGDQLFNMGSMTVPAMLGVADLDAYLLEKNVEQYKFLNGID